MPSQVSPISGASVPIPPRPENADSFILSVPEDTHSSEKTLKRLSEIYSPALKLMKLFGIYYGNTNLKHLEYTTGSHAGKHILSQIYSGLMVSLLWLNFVMAIVGIFTSGQSYVVSTLAFGNLLIAITAMILLIVLPLTVAKRSRFEMFLRGFLANVNKDINLEAGKQKSRRGYITFCLLYISTVAIVLVGDQMLHLNLASFEPWNQWSGLRIISLFSALAGGAVWLLSILFFYLTCITVEECFNGLYERMSSSPPLTVDLLSLKMEYYKLSKVIELADKMLAPLLLGIVALNIPLLCFSFYVNAIIFPSKTNPMFLASNLSWSLIAAGVLAMVLFFGSKVNEKMHSFQKVLQTLPISAAEEGKVLMFLLDLQGDPKGFSIGGLVVITKSTSLTIAGVIVSYFAVMLSLPR